MPHCQTIITELRQHGYRLTPQREMIIETIAHAGRHVTAEEILAEVQNRTQAINVATIYRTLELLVALGLVSKTDLGEGKVSYASPKHGPHCHLVCRICGQVIEANHQVVVPLQRQLQEEYGFVANLTHFAISGLCAQCQEDDPGCDTNKEV